MTATLRLFSADSTPTRVGGLVRRFGKQIRYVASSLSSTGVDYIMLLVLNATISGLFAPVVIARTTSCTMNYLINRRVFAARGGLIATGLRYAAWEATIMMLAYASIRALTGAGAPLWFASIAANSSLFALNYLGQSYLVFGVMGRRGQPEQCRRTSAESAPPHAPSPDAHSVSARSSSPWRRISSIMMSARPSETPAWAAAALTVAPRRSAV